MKEKRVYKIIISVTNLDNNKISKNDKIILIESDENKKFKFETNNNVNNNFNNIDIKISDDSLVDNMEEGT